MDCGVYSFQQFGVNSVPLFSAEGSVLKGWLRENYWRLTGCLSNHERRQVGGLWSSYWTARLVTWY